MTDNIKPILSKYTADIKQAIQDTLSHTPPFIRGVINYHFGWMDRDFKPANFDKGKMLRPTLCLLVFDALTGSHQDALPVAAAIEMVHNFSLIHDDIEDDDLERRGRATVWAIWGKPLAINTGDYLYTLALDLLHHLDPTRFSTNQIFAVQRSISKACLSLTMGQDLDLRFEQMQEVTAAMYLDMVCKKTAALLETSILCGALLGTYDKEIIENYRNFAQNIGIAFQVRDDILGIWGESLKTGKSADNDLRRKKKTLPVIYTLNKVTGQRQKKLWGLYASDQPLTYAEVKFARECLTWTEAQGYAQDIADKYINDAFTALDKINISNQAQSELVLISHFLIERSH